MKHLKYLNKFFYRYRFRLLLGVLFVAVSNYFNILSPQVIRHTFNLVGENILIYRALSGFELQSSFTSVFSTALMFFGVVVLLFAMVKGAFMFLMRQTIIVVSRLVEYDLKNDIYEHYQKLSLSFYKRNNTGDMMSRISEDVGRVRMYVGPAIMYSVNLVVLFIFAISVMLSVNVEMTLYALAPLPILSISIYYINNLINRRSEVIQQRLSGLTSIAQESYSGIRVIKSYVQERQMLRFFDEESGEYKEAALKLARVQAFFFPMMMLLIGLSTILTIYIGGQGVIAGQITAGNIAEFVIYVNMLTWPVTAIGWVASIVQRAAASQKRINEFLFTEPEIVSPEAEPIAIKGEIEFRNVSFTYPDTGIEAIKNVSFHLRPGEKMAIIGRTGSGKTTIADLLVRMYDVTEGEVLIDGKPVSQIDLGSVRQQIGYVPQDVFLFSDDVANNVAFGTDGVDNDRIVSATKNSSIHSEILTLDKGYDTVVGERGVTLSGGQKQRISIARAFVKKPKVIVLDDSLSAVDAKTEKVILNNFKTELDDKTAIIITHRIFTLLDFDKIIVLDKGKLAESGTHNELMERKGLYFELFENQQQEDKITS